MLRLLGKLPFDCYVAVSGGADSMAALDFLNNNKRKITVLYFNHGTAFGKDSQKFLEDYCLSKKLDLKIGNISQEKSSDLSWEEYWRNQRYTWFANFSDKPIIMAHNLNDQMENWLFTSIHGLGRLIPYSNKNIIRPFMLNDKGKLIDWCTSHNVPWLEDPSNQDVKYMRNKIRADILPEVLKVNPGFAKVIAKKVMNLVK